MDFDAASGYLIQRLRRELNQTLSYHCVEHTLDVLDAATRLTNLEHVGPREKKLILTASLFHDAGMIVQYHDHESASVDLATAILPEFGYTKPDIDEIAGLIMVTKLPQRPYSHAEQIICDADLDYLGRDDFFILSFRLQLEWKLNGIRDTSLAEWLDIQVRFLSDHRYFTNSAIILRNEIKLKHLQEVSQICQKMNPNS